MPVGTESPPAPSKERLQVGSWAVEPALNQLSAAGRTVKLKPKAMAVLVYLANRPGQVVSREELLSAVWSGVVVSDDSLTQVVIKLRKALGDAPEDPAYIQTISKGGYRLVAPVVRSAEISSAPVRPDSERLYAERKRRVPWIAGAGMAALLVAAAGAWWIMGERVTPMAGTEAARMAQPTVAIRPFEALGNDPQEVLLARGITADLLTDLSKVSGLWVIGFAPMDGRASGEAPSDAPPVRYLVSGTVQRVDKRLRLHVHLTDRERGKQLWSERFGRGERDLSRNVPARHRAGRGFCSRVCRARTDLRRGLSQSVERKRRRRARPRIRDGPDCTPDQPGRSGDLLGAGLRARATAPARAGAAVLADRRAALSVVRRWLCADGQRQHVRWTSGGCRAAAAHRDAPQPRVRLSLFSGARARLPVPRRPGAGAGQSRAGIDAQRREPRGARLHGSRACRGGEQNVGKLGSGRNPHASARVFRPPLAGNLSDDRHCSEDEAHAGARRARVLRI